MNWFLKTCWVIGCFFQKLFGKVDAYYGASSWDDAFGWLKSHDRFFTSIQYWGHGSPGCVYLAGRTMRWSECVERLRYHVLSGTVLWFRTCSTFRGTSGHELSEALADGLVCTIAGHTRIIGLVQGGLHTRRPYKPASWPVSEGEPPKSWIPGYLRWGPNSVLFTATRIPKGW